MLHDPKKNLSLVDMIDWLEAQPPEGEYAWNSTRSCLVAQYIKARTGAKTAFDVIGYEQIFPGMNVSEQLRNYQRVGSTLPWTFGAALERANKLMCR